MTEQLGADGLTDVQRLAARDEIRQLAARYALAIDLRDVDALVALFVPEVRVSPGRDGHDELRRFWGESLGAIGPSMLLVGNHIVDVETADRAHGTVYCRAVIAEAGRTIEQGILYHDRYARRDGRWLFVGRRHELFYGVETAEQPFAQPPAEWPTRSVGSGTVPFEAPSWVGFWAERGTPPTGGRTATD